MDKKELRSHIRRLKRLHTSEQLARQSDTIMARLENNPHFVNANVVMMYNALPDEVQTAAFIEKWRNKKRIILPTVSGDDIIPVELAEETICKIGDFNILEPQNTPYTGSFDLIVVPGVAFDQKGNRIGRGRGYYDRFLCKHPNVRRVGICFDFQVVENVPTEPNDIRMDEIITLQ